MINTHSPAAEQRQRRRLARVGGYTLLELIAFIGLAGLVIAGALILYFSGSTAAKNQDIIKSANELALSVRKTCESGGYVGCLTNSNNFDKVEAPVGWELSASDRNWVERRGVRLGVFSEAATPGAFRITIDPADDTLLSSLRASTVFGNAEVGAARTVADQAQWLITGA